MGLISGLCKVAVVSGIGLYTLGRSGLRTCARYAGYTMGHSLGRMRRSRQTMQAKLTHEQTPEREQAAKEMQRGWWEVRMILNEWAMMRSLNPRLLQSGNFGFTDAEMLQAIGLSTKDMDELKAKRNAQRERHIDLDRQQLENPRMYPIAGFHGDQDDVSAYQQYQERGLDGPPSQSPGMDPLSGKVYYGSDTYQQEHASNSGSHATEDPSEATITRADGSSYKTKIQASYRAAPGFESDTAQTSINYGSTSSTGPSISRSQAQENTETTGSSLMKQVVEDTRAMEYMRKQEKKG